MTTPPSKKTLDEHLANVKVLAQRLGLQTHAGAAMLVATALDRMLEDALTIRMVKLNRETRDNLFGDYGTLRDFSAKINVAFALGLVDRQHYKLLTTIRKCRNLFAHSRDLLSFESPEIQALLELGAAKPVTVKSIEDFILLGELVEAHVAEAAQMQVSGNVSKLREL